MAYCDIQQSFLGKKLDDMFLQANRNKMASIVTSPDFQQWFGKGRMDVDGNPVIDETLSFTNEKGEKKSVFDFPAINFQNTGEVKKLLRVSPAITVHKGELFINNTKQDVAGQFLARNAMKMINVINYYYPGLLSIDIYQRKGGGEYSKDRSIPLPIIKVDPSVPLVNSAGLFSVHNGNGAEREQERFDQARSIEDLKNLQTTIDEFKGFGLTPAQVEKMSQHPEVSEEVYNKLIGFLKDLNPNFKVEEVAGLSANGIAYIYDFIIKVDRDAKFAAIPEEVSHFFIELLPRDSLLRKDLLSNIMDFAIYKKTLDTYKNKPEYKLENGNVNYDKIKREAAAKLLGEYIYAISENDSSRIRLLTTTKDGWLKRWWNRFVAWIKGAHIENRKRALQAYHEAAMTILNQDISYLSMQEIFDRTENGIFFSESETNKVAMAQEIMAHVQEAGKVDDLQAVIDNFRKDLAKNYIRVVKEETFKKLDKELSTTKEGAPDLNYLAELYDVIKKVDITEKSINNILSADNQMLNLSEFLGVISNMERLAKAIDTIADSYKDMSDPFKNITELQSFRNIYSNFRSFVNNDLIRILVDSSVETDIINEINKTTAIFTSVEGKLLNRLRDNLSIWMKQRHAPLNTVVINEYIPDMKRDLKLYITDSAMIQKVENIINNYISNLESSKTKLQSKEEFLRELTEAKVPNKALKSPVFNRVLTAIEDRYVSSKSIDNILSGLGKDIDPLSYASHIMTAAVKNYDTVFADVANFVVSNKTASQNVAYTAIKDYQAKVDDIMKQLKEQGLDEYKAGTSVTYIDQVVDKSLNSAGMPLYENGMRDIVKFLGPVMNSVEIRLEELRHEMTVDLAKYNEFKKTGDVTSTEGKALRAKYIQSKKAFIDFEDRFYNSRYNAELQAFQKKWNQNEDFLEIRDEYNLLSEQIRAIEDAHENDRSSIDYENRQLLIRQRSLLLNESKRTGRELEQTKLLKEYFKEKKKYMVEDQRKTLRNFTLAKNSYETKIDIAIATFLKNNPTEESRDLDTLEKSMQATLKDPSFKVKGRYRHIVMGEEDISDTHILGDDEIEALKFAIMETWERRNKVRVRNQKYYDYRDELLTAIEAQRAKKELSVLDEHISSLHKEINDLLFDRTDAYGQKDPSLLTPVERARVEEIENALVVMGAFKVKTYKILDEQKSKPAFKQHLDHIKTYEEAVQELSDFLTGTTPTDIGRMTELRDEIHSYNDAFTTVGIITPKQIELENNIALLWSELASFTDKVPTQQYLERMEDLIPILEQLQSEALSEKNNATVPPTGFDLARLNSEIKNLERLIFHIEDAIHSGDYAKLDQIINDEYFSKAVDENGKLISSTPVEFKKYIEAVEQGVSEPGIIEQMDPDFFDWFQSAHKLGVAFVAEEDPEIPGEYLEKKKRVERDYTRRAFYVHSEPSQFRPDYYDVKEAKKYRASKINEDYYQKQVSWKDTDNMEDWTVDNREGRPRYLPLSRKQRRAAGNNDETYLNKDYYRLQDSTSTTDNLLKQFHSISVKTYFQEQESKPDEIKSGLNLPVTGLDTVTRMKSTVTNLKDRVKRNVQHVKGLFVPEVDTDAEDMVEGVSQMRDVDEITQNIIEKKIPALGMNAKLPVDRVNRNVIHAISSYISHSKDFDTRSDLQPFMQGLLDVMKANQSTAGYQSQKRRTQLFDQIYSQMILHEQPKNLSNMRFFRKITNRIMGLTSLKLMADVMGGSINYVQANINNLVESFAGEFLTRKDYVTGYMKATEMIGQMVIDFNKKSNYSFWTLIYQSFDFIQGEWEEDVLERTSTSNKKFNWQKVMMYPRKNGELHAQSAMAIGILNNNKATNSITGKKHPIHEIYEKKDGELVLKDGFDPALYNLKDGKEFMRIKALIHSVNFDLHGNYAKVNQTEASRHSIGKLAENMKRWFVSGFQRRFGREFLDVNSQKLSEGYYRTPTMAVVHAGKQLLKLNMDGVKGEFQYYWSTPRKKRNLIRFATESTACVLLMMLSTSAMFLGYDDDDEDKNKKLRKASWLHNELLLLALRSFAEQTAYYPFPPLGYTEMTRNLLDPFSVAKNSFSNAVGASVLMVYTAGYYLGIDQLEDDVFYQRDTGAGKGPTFLGLGTQGKKGDLKLANYLLKTFGYTGSQWDPAYYIKNYEAIQNRLK